jgi:hypothetical protein
MDNNIIMEKKKKKTGQKQARKPVNSPDRRFARDKVESGTRIVTSSTNDTHVILVVDDFVGSLGCGCRLG